MKTAAMTICAAICASTGAAIAAGETATQATSGASGLETRATRLVEHVISPSRVDAQAQSLWGEPVASIAGTAPRGCEGESTLLSNGFDDTQWIAQAGFAENEIMAASYQVPAASFPLRIDAIQGLFVTSNTTISTTTEYTVFVWEGTPNNGNLVFTFSSDDVVLPHILIPPGNNATLVEVSVDPSDPEQIVVQNNGTATFSIGYRIDKHNNQTQNPCFVAPPSASNAFPATDNNGLGDAQNNWLFAVDCGFLGCRAGWSRFSQLGLCTPSGDWALAARWTSLSCTPGVGACCLPDGSCTIDAEGACTAAGGTFQGDGSVCEDVVCQIAPGACCFESTGGCVNLDGASCTAVGGVPQGPGTVCSQITCFPEGACCLPDGSCADGLSPEECAMMNGVFEGDGTTCAATNCPEPTGACCFANGFCLELVQGDCAAAAGSWAGPGTGCEDANGNGLADDCEAGCNIADIAEPFGLPDLQDLTAFVTAFQNQQGVADVAPPTGVWDLQDLSLFVMTFMGGCP